jgi:RNA polymerase sigma factor (sigma-70 family)
MDVSPSSFERLYDRHLQSVYAFIAYRVRDRDLAEDLTQTTFERALRAWSRFDPRRASEKTWLMVIARNLLIDHFRKHREEPVAEIDERGLRTVAGPEQNLPVAAELVAALGQLGEREREVLALRFGGELTGPEIAELLGLSLANVQQITSRSLRRLRGLLDDAGVVRPVSSG